MNHRLPPEKSPQAVSVFVTLHRWMVDNMNKMNKIEKVKIAGFVFSTWKMRLEAMLKCVKARIDQMIGGKK